MGTWVDYTFCSCKYQLVSFIAKGKTEGRGMEGTGENGVSS